MVYKNIMNMQKSVLKPMIITIVISIKLHLDQWVLDSISEVQS